MRGCAGFLAAIVAAGWLAPGCAAAMDEGLPRIGQAPEFNLITQDRQRLSLADLRGKVVVVTFIFASCKDACPLLTAKLATLQPRLGTDFGPRAYFASVTVDPERDTPDVLRRYAEGHGAQLAGWAFLTGTPAEIREVAGRYGVVYKKNRNGDVDHSFLTSVVDQRGMLRVQYVGIRFDPEELLTDIRSLLREGSQ